MEKPKPSKALSAQQSFSIQTEIHLCSHKISWPAVKTTADTTETHQYLSTTEANNIFGA
jgi:hypothetical protein